MTAPEDRRDAADGGAASNDDEPKSPPETAETAEESASSKDGAASKDTAASKDGAAPPRADAEKPMPEGAVRFANRGLWFFAALFAMNLLFALHLHRKPGMTAFAAVGLAAVLLVRLRGKPQLRLSIVLSLVPLFLGLSGFEILMSRKRPRDGTAAYLRGLPFDSRGLFEVVHDAQKTDPSVQSFVIPRALLTHNLDAPRWADEMLSRRVQPNWGVMIDGAQTLPLGGVSNRPTVFCNEGGYWAIYDADEHGYNNPKGIWGAPPLDLVILGDSYSQGACVPSDKITAAHLRKRYPKTLTLGMCANGPLMEYANFKEHVVDLKPKILLWVYYDNDLSDMAVEQSSDLLLRYVNDDAFRQNLRSRQTSVDAALDAYLNNVGARAPAWPSALNAVGLTRTSTPLFLQDIVMREQHSSVTSFLRLDWFTNAVTTRFFERTFFADKPNWDLFRTVLTKARTTVQGWGGQAYFVYLPDVFYLRPGMTEPNRKNVLESAQAAGMKIIDVHERFMQLPKPDSYRPHYEAHFTEEGFELVAQFILEALQKDGL